MPQGMQIGKVSKQTGLSIDAIRFYEKKGLLKGPPRSQGGYRLFGPEEVRSLHFIRKAQELGFSLSEIRELLVLGDQRTHACSHVRDWLEQKLASVREKMEELKKLEADLRKALRKCNRELNRKGNAREECCPVLDEIGRANGNEEK